MEYVVLPVRKGFSKFLLHVYARKDNLFAVLRIRSTLICILLLFFFLCSLPFFKLFHANVASVVGVDFGYRNLFAIPNLAALSAQSNRIISIKRLPRLINIRIEPLTLLCGYAYEEKVENRPPPPNGEFLCF